MWNDTVLIYVDELGDLQGQTLKSKNTTPTYWPWIYGYSTNHRLNELMQSDMNAGGENQTEICE